MFVYSIFYGSFLKIMSYIDIVPSFFICCFRGSDESSSSNRPGQVAVAAKVTEEIVMILINEDEH